MAVLQSDFFAEVFKHNSNTLNVGQFSVMFVDKENENKYSVQRRSLFQYNNLNLDRNYEGVFDFGIRFFREI